MTKSSVAIACAGLLAALAACGDSTPDKLTGDAGSGGGGGSGGSGGSGGTGGSSATGCRALELPGDLAEGEWSPDFTIAGLSGTDGLVPKVYDFAKEPDGSLVATGFFRWTGKEATAPLVRRNGNEWVPARTEWNLEVPPGGFSAVAISDVGVMVLATHNFLPPLGGEIWLERGPGFEAIGHFDGQIRTMLWRGGELWVAGNYLMDEGGAAGLSIWDGSNWQAPPGGGPDGPVFELLPDGDSLLVGGGFAHIGGIATRAIAEFDGTDWIAHDFDLGAGTVHALARGSDGTLYAGGPMFRDPEEGRGGIARFDGTHWQLLGEGLASGFIPGVVADLQVFQDQLYVAGCFTHVNGARDGESAIEARSVARWNGSGWDSLNPLDGSPNTAWFDPVACGDEGPDAIWGMQMQRFFVDGDRLYLGGSFSGVDGVHSQSLVAFDGENWLPQGSSGGGIAGSIDAMAAGGPDCSLYALGRFTHAGGVRTAGLVHRGAEGWEPMGADRPAGLWCPKMAVDSEGQVFVACTSMNDEMPKAHIYRIDGDTWSPVGEPNELWPAQDLSFDGDGKLWIVGGGETGYVARLEDDKFEVVEDGFDGMVYRMAFSPDGKRLVVSGMFNQVGEVPAQRIAHFDGSSWTALGDGMISTVMAVEYGENGIYAATQFEGDERRAILARWDGTAWIELGTPANGLPAPMGQSVHSFTSLMERGGKLIATGYVWPEEGGRNAFLWDGERISSIGGGVAAISVDAAALTADGLWFGGTIAEAGRADAPIPTVGVAQFRWK